MDDGSLGRHGLGSSSSWLDGVPFKIGPKFRPPPKVIYQPVIQSSSQFPKDEYTFETEEAVLAWAQAREEALKKATTEQAEKASKNSSNAKKDNETEQPAKETKEGNNAGVENHNDSTPSQTTNAGEDNSVKTEARHCPSAAAKPLIPKKLPEPGAILKPTPIQRSNKVTNQNGNGDTTKSLSNSIVDVSMFESVSDPFDTLELQTINDMEELKVLLDTTSSSNSLEKDDPQQNKSENNNQTTESSEGIYDLAAPVSMDNWVKFEENASSNNDTLQNNLNKLQEPNLRSSESPASDDIGDYVDIEDLACLNPKVSGSVPVEMTNSDSTPVISNVLPGSNTPKVDPAKGIYKQVLPPIPHNHLKMFNGEGTTTTHSLEQNENAPHPNSTTAAVSMSTSALSVSFSNEAVPAPPSANTKPDYPKPARVAPLPPTKPNRPPPPTASPRNSSQTSSPRQPLTNSSDTNSNPAEPLVSNPYSRHSTNPPSYSDMPGYSQINGPQHPPINQLNRYSPLPPPPTPKPKEVGLTDPYHSLSLASREFIDRVTSMGFIRAKVARAVEKFGQDEKEVLDHLFAVDMLVEKKYAPIHVEAALQSCKNDLEKAENFLKLQAQFEQLGYSSETVRDALVSSGMDHDKALDILTT